jgi:hypothetical protein
MVGFALDIRSEARMMKSAGLYLANCPLTALTPPDSLCLISDRSGGELRLALRKTATGALDLVTLNPGFDGEGRVEVEIDGDVSDPDWKPFEVTMSARFAGEETPLVFDLADPQDAGQLKPGAKVTMEVAAFSYEPAVYADEAAYMKAQTATGAKVQLGSNFFIPSGMFLASAGGAMPEGSSRPTAYADLAGAVVKSELRTNDAGKGRFWWALVRTYGGATIDVVIDPKTIRNEPKAGSIVTGRFWLSARLLPAL